MNDTYVFDDSDDEARDTMDEIDAFERRMRGEAPKQKPGQQPKAYAPKPARPAVKSGSTYVQSAVKAQQLTEDELAAAEAKVAVSDLDKFEQQNLR